MSEPCAHNCFAAEVKVARLTDDSGVVRNYMAEVTVRCAECNEPFHFVGLPAGLSWRHPTVDLGGLTLYAPISPGLRSGLPSQITFEAVSGDPERFS